MTPSDPRPLTPDTRTKRIWLVNPYGPIPGEPWSDYRFTLLARALAARGHEVTWFTATFAHQSKQQRADGWERREISDRFAIELVPTPRYGRNIGPARLRFEFLFARRVYQRASRMARPDVIIAEDPPQVCGAVGRRLARHHGVPLVIDCMDLWPELFVSASPPALRWLVAIAVAPLRVLRRRNLRASSLAVAVAESYRVVLEREGARRTATISIGVNLDAFGTPQKHAGGPLTLIYAGSFGQHYDLDTLLDVVSAMPDVLLTIAGRGPAEQRLRERAASMRNVTFAGSVDAERLATLYAAAGAGLAPYRAGSTVALPTKLFDYLAAGLPAITSLGGDAGTLVETTGAGVRYAPGDAASLRAAIGVLRDPVRRGEMAVAAHAAARQFDARALYERYADAVEATVRG